MDLKIENMTCGGCAKSVTKAIQSVDSAAKIETNPAARAVKVEPDEAIDVAWLPLHEAHRHLTFPNERRIARVAWQRLAGEP